MHTRELTKKGVPIEEPALVQAWKEGGDLFNGAERAALAWAETDACGPNGCAGRCIPDSTPLHEAGRRNLLAAAQELRVARYNSPSVGFYHEAPSGTLADELATRR